MLFSSEQLSNIPHIISEPRFATYLQNCNNDRIKALQLYQWNLQLSSAFVIPLHLLEISIRNAVVEALEQVHTSNWPWTQGFILSLPNPHTGYNPRRSLVSIAQSQRRMGKVVAELNLVFWEKMFTSRHDERIWNNHIKSIFPHSPANMTASQVRAYIHNYVREIRELRNRIAHHEPIFLRNTSNDYENILKIIAWRNRVTSEWMDSFQTVTKLIVEKPMI
jgi:hypothetical protein